MKRSSAHSSLLTPHSSTPPLLIQHVGVFPKKINQLLQLLLAIRLLAFRHRFCNASLEMIFQHDLTDLSQRSVAADNCIKISTQYSSSSIMRPTASTWPPIRRNRTCSFFLSSLVSMRWPKG